MIFNVSDVNTLEIEIKKSLQEKLEKRYYVNMYIRSSHSGYLYYIDGYKK